MLLSAVATTQAEGEAGRKILYYRNPMGLPDTSPTPKKDGMGMDYIAVYEGEEDDGGSTVQISLDKVQRAGVRTETAERRSLVRIVRAPGVAKPDERTLHTVTLRADGFIDKLYVNTTGQHVKAGEPLFRLYSPAIVSAQIDYKNQLSTAGARSRESAELYAKVVAERFRRLGVPEAEIERLRTTGSVSEAFDVSSPIDGIVLQKNVIEGQMAKTGEELYRLVDLSSIWVIADVAEQDFSLVRIGAPAKVRFRAFPDELFEGRATFVLHELEMSTRTAKVRVEVRNPGHRIKHEMFADVEIDAGSGDDRRLSVPASAVIDNGSRQIVLVERGEGRFEPRPVKLGLRGDGLIEVREGLEAGEKVVVSANFLIDAESNLRAALKSFAPDGETKP
jgi:Cu(I)/Ag(I) efflux system membrane fusion protein